MNSIKRCSCLTCSWYHYLADFFSTYRRAWFCLVVPWYENMTSSVKPEVHNVSEEDWAVATGNMHKKWWDLAVQFLSYARGQTVRQTNRYTHYNTSNPSCGKVIITIIVIMFIVIARVVHSDRTMCCRWKGAGAAATVQWWSSWCYICPRESAHRCHHLMCLPGTGDRRCSLPHCDDDRTTFCTCCPTAQYLACHTASGYCCCLLHFLLVTMLRDEVLAWLSIWSKV